MMHNGRASPYRPDRAIYFLSRRFTSSRTWGTMLTRAVFSEGDAARPITASQPPGRACKTAARQQSNRKDRARDRSRTRDCRRHFGLGLDVEAVIETISKGGAQSWQMENRSWALAPIFRLHGRILPPAGVESGLVAYSTGP